MKVINYYYTQLDEGYEIDWREMPIWKRIKIIFSLLTNRIIFIEGVHKNHYANEVQDE